jgi:hypothetical protein
MSFKIFFFNLHLDFFFKNLGAVSQKQGKHFHQNIKKMGRRYQGQLNVNMMGNYCCRLQLPQIIFCLNIFPH